MFLFDIKHLELTPTFIYFWAYYSIDFAFDYYYSI